MFHPDYKYITDKLPISLVNRAYNQLLHHSRNPILPEQIFEKCNRIEELHHKLNVYENSLNWRHKTMDQKKLRPQSWPDCPLSLTLPISYVLDNEYKLTILPAIMKQKLIAKLKMNLSSGKNNCLIIIMKHLADSCKN
ncbi:unnamed protein product [Rhizophagus irregularis]|nr:unnamed protein product [Rhizophagus irregularis]